MRFYAVPLRIAAARFFITSRTRQWAGAETPQKLPNGIRVAHNHTLPVVVPQNEERVGVPLVGQPETGRAGLGQLFHRH